MNIEQIRPNTEQRTFSLHQANEILPLVFHITESSHKLVKQLANRLQAVRDRNSLLVIEIEEAISQEVTKWENKLRRLGIKPKGTWLADFDSGTGYYCWKFPENEIRFWHGYKDGFTGRIEVQ